MGRPTNHTKQESKTLPGLAHAAPSAASCRGHLWAVRADNENCVEPPVDRAHRLCCDVTRGVATDGHNDKSP